jgi:hypothetical protein
VATTLHTANLELLRSTLLNKLKGAGSNTIEAVDDPVHRRHGANRTMAVIELTLLRLRDPTTVTSASLIAHFKEAKDAMEKCSGFKFFFLHCFEDPSLVFPVGGWPSVRFYMEEWLPSREKQELIALTGEVEDQYSSISTWTRRRERVMWNVGLLEWGDISSKRNKGRGLRGLSVKGEVDWRGMLVGRRWRR